MFYGCWPTRRHLGTSLLPFPSAGVANGRATSRINTALLPASFCILLHSARGPGARVAAAREWRPLDALRALQILLAGYCVLRRAPHMPQQFSPLIPRALKGMDPFILIFEGSPLPARFYSHPECVDSGSSRIYAHTRDDGFPRKIGVGTPCPNGRSLRFTCVGCIAGARSLAALRALWITLCPSDKRQGKRNDNTPPSRNLYTQPSSARAKSVGGTHQRFRVDFARLWSTLVYSIRHPVLL